MIARWVVLAFLAFSCSLQAADDKILIQMLYDNAKEKYQMLNQKIEHCQKLEKPITDTTLKNHVLTRAQWRSAIVYLHDRAQKKCLNHSSAIAAVAFESYFNFEKMLIGSNITPIKVSDNRPVTQATLAVWFYEDAQRELTLKQHFETLPLNIREKLEKTPEFNTPFQFSSVWVFLDTLQKSEQK